jgi:hypothetical protein
LNGFSSDAESFSLAEKYFSLPHIKHADVSNPLSKIAGYRNRAS